MLNHVSLTVSICMTVPCCEEVRHSKKQVKQSQYSYIRQQSFSGFLQHHRSECTAYRMRVLAISDVMYIPVLVLGFNVKVVMEVVLCVYKHIIRHGTSLLNNVNTLQCNFLVGSDLLFPLLSCGQLALDLSVSIVIMFL